jgi:hypothetical protein
MLENNMAVTINLEILAAILAIAVGLTLIGCGIYIGVKIIDALFDRR